MINQNIFFIKRTEYELLSPSATRQSTILSVCSKSQCRTGVSFVKICLPRGIRVHRERDQVYIINIVVRARENRH